jgi:Ser-tRNA(Ala) deacylase AlaX
MSTASVLKCQEDSYLAKWRSNVVSCEPVKLDDLIQYDVVLEDTIVFPEGKGLFLQFVCATTIKFVVLTHLGGGQPSDTGKLDGAELISCFRQVI